MFGAVKLEDLEKGADGAEEAPKMGAVKLEEVLGEGASEEASLPEKDVSPEEAPKMGEQKSEAKPAEVFVPKIPGAKEEEAPVEDTKGLDAASFQMDMMVEADEDISAAGGIFSGAPTADKTIKPIQSAIFQQDSTNFKGKTATHADSVFETDKAIKDEQEEKKKIEQVEEAVEQEAKRVNKAWGIGTGNASELAAKVVKEEVDKMKEGQKIEEEPAKEPKKVADTTSLPASEAEPAKTADNTGGSSETADAVKANSVAQTAEEETAPVGIFTTKPAKGSFFKKFLGNMQAIFNKPIGKAAQKPEKPEDTKK